MSGGGYREKAWSSDEEASRAIKRALRDSHGSAVTAAQILGVSYRTLSRYITRLGLRNELKLIKTGRGPEPPMSADSDYAALATTLLMKSKGRKR
jgi:hypothetical protein